MEVELNAGGIIFAAGLGQRTKDKKKLALTSLFILFPKENLLLL